MNQDVVAISKKPTLTGATRLLASDGLPVSDLTDEHMTEFLYTGRSEAPEALVGLELYGSEALLRSLVVSETLRSAGSAALSSQRLRSMRANKERARYTS